MNYLNAVEQRILWLQWLDSDEGRALARDFPEHVEPMYRVTLKHGATFYLRRDLCERLDGARRTVPDDLIYDASWAPSDNGFLYLEKPFKVPPVLSDRLIGRDKRALRSMNIGIPDEIAISIKAVGWAPVNPDEALLLPDGSRESIPNRTLHFCFFSDRAQGMPTTALRGGFWPWSYFGLFDGLRLRERLIQFERLTTPSSYTAAYTPHKTNTSSDDPNEWLNHPLHEMRWLYATLQLLASTKVCYRDHYVATCNTIPVTRNGHSILQMRQPHRVREISDHDFHG